MQETGVVQFHQLGMHLIYEHEPDKETSGYVGKKVKENLSFPFSFSFLNYLYQAFRERVQGG